MVDPLSLAVGACIFVAGYLARLATSRMRSGAETPKAPKCPCGHVVSVHEPDGGACRVEVQRDKYNMHGDWVGHEYAPCACTRYLGPELLRDVWAPELGPR